MRNKKLLERYLKGVISGKYTYVQAAYYTGYSTKHLSKLRKIYELEGYQGLLHRGKGRTPSNKIPAEKRRWIADLYVSDYSGYTFAFYRDILEDDYDMPLCYRTLYNILHEFKIKSPEKHHIKKVEPHHRTRPRREHEGELLQIDGTPYQWFKWCGDKKYYCLHGGVDDATSKLKCAYMTENECLYGYMEMLRFLDTKGELPQEIYSDRAGIFCKTPQKAQQLTIEEQLRGLKESHTQWQRILEDLNIKQVLAWSPQAKGRVERMWSTVQKRLPHYFKKYKIKDIKSANEFIEKYFLDIYNNKFAVKANSEDTFYIKPELDMSEVLCARFPAHTDANGQFKFHSYLFAVTGARYCACKKIEVCISEKGVRACINGEYYPVRAIDDITDGRAEYMPKVVKNILHEYLYKDMKKDAA